MTRSSQVAIIGAGPYGLSIAAHLRARGIKFRIFGSPMYSWRKRMPAGMFLKSEGFASDLYDPKGRFTLKRFCVERGLPYNDIGCPIPLETFASYGLAFQQEFVPNIEDRTVTALDRSSDGFLLQLADGEIVTARHVIVAVGITYFSHMPAGLAHLPRDAVSHSSDHWNFNQFKGQNVSVIGGGASALDIVAALHDIGADVRLIARESSLYFNIPKPQAWWKRWCPTPALGAGWRNQFYQHAPMLFRRLPGLLRREIVRSWLGPAGGAAIKDRVELRPLLLGHSLRYAEFCDRQVQLHLLSSDDEERTVPTDHVIAGTGYKVDLRRLRFLSRELRQLLKSAHSTPILSAQFQSSVPGLYFAGLATANTFGPVMRFLIGARYTARVLAKHFAS
jgi:thioredoxin reductase